MASGQLESLPEDVLLHIIHYLSVEDILSLTQLNDRLHCLCYDRTIVRKTSFENCSMLKEEDLREYIENSCRHIQHLNFNHCYWLPSRSLQWAILKCKRLTSLHVIETKLKIQPLVGLVAQCTNLQDLSFSLYSFADIKRDVFNSARDTMKNVRRLKLYYTSRELTIMNYLGEHPTLLDFCDHLEELHISSAGMAIPELYRPLLSEPKKLSSLRVMTITNNIHAGAQMLFYGTLSQLPTTKLHWHTLLMPNVNFTEFLKKAEFRGCFQNMETLRHLDVSGSKVAFPNEAMDMTRAVNLGHVNVGLTKINSEQLSFLSVNCNRLTSLNLFGCGAIFQGRDGLDMCGLEAVFDNCPKLQHLNLGGEHHHHLVLPGEQDTQRVLNKIRGLWSLCLPVCLLCHAEMPQGRSGKRALSASRSPVAPAKRRCLDTSHSSLSEAQSSESDASPSYTSSGGGGSSSSRISLVSQGNSHIHTFLERVVNNNSDLRELELVAVNFSSAIHKNKYINPKQQQFGPCVETRRVKDAILEPIGHLTELRSLVVMGAPGLVSGQWLLAVARGCKKLSLLSIGYLGGSMYGNMFSQAIGHMDSLQDLRIEQPHLYLNAALFESLSHCTQLRRLCIIAKHSTFQQQDVLKLVEQLQHLTVLQLFVGGTIKMCKNLTSMLCKRFHRSRPALSVAIYPLLYDGLIEVTKAIPAKHFDELTRFQSRVGLLPPDWS